MALLKTTPSGINPPTTLAGVGLPKPVTPPPESHMLPLLCVRADGLVAWQSPTTLGETGTKEELNFISLNI